MTEQEERIRVGALTVSANVGAIVEMFERAPRRTYFHLRDTLGAIMGSHRREWLKRTEVEFHRGGMSAAAIGRKEGSGFTSDRKFFYTVEPQTKTPPKGSQPDLGAIQADAFTRSEVALGLETGGTFRSRRSRFLAIPIGHALNSRGIPKPGLSSPAALRRNTRLVNKETIVFQDRGQVPVVYLIDRLGGLQKDGTRRIKRRVRLLPVFQLVPQVRKQPVLKFLDTWDALEGDRDRRFATALSKIVEDVEQGRG